MATCDCGTDRSGESSNDGIRLSKGGKILTTACKICAKPIGSTCACRPLGTSKKRRQKKAVSTGTQTRFGAPVQHRLVGRLYRSWGQRRDAAEQHQSSQDRRRKRRLQAVRDLTKTDRSRSESNGSYTNRHFR